MLSPALGRVVLSAPTKSTPAALATHSYLSSRITAASPSLPPLRRTHQRRYSSSNPSCPPGRSKSATPQSASNNSSSKPGKRKSKEPATSQANNQPFSNFPSVPSTKHLSVRDILLSRFFSSHRPMPINGGIPPTMSDEAFNAIFEPKSPSRKSREVMSTLSNTVRNMENASDESALRWEILAEAEANAEPVHHLDGVTQQVESVGDLIGKFQDFQPPPAPSPVNEADAAEVEQGVGNANHRDIKTERKSWSVTVTVTESTSPDGQKICDASVSPPMRIPNPPADVEDQSPGRRFVIRQPFLERMAEREERWNDSMIRQEKPSMLAISVKRQRKLKMKKHKYKKLMKRTRHLRRKLERG